MRAPLSAFARRAQPPGDPKSGTRTAERPQPAAVENCNEHRNEDHDLSKGFRSGWIESRRVATLNPKKRRNRWLKSVAITGTRGYPSYYGGFNSCQKLAPFLVDGGWDVNV